MHVSTLEAAGAGEVAELRDVWESTGFALELLQSSVETVAAERDGLAARVASEWRLPWTPAWTPPELLGAPDKPRVAILRYALPLEESGVAHILPSIEWTMKH